MSHYRPARYRDDFRDVDYDEDCEGFGYCNGCEGCEKETSVSRKVIARAPRTEKGRARREKNGIRVGDTIWVTTGFHYQVNGPRGDYFRSEKLADPGPAWDEREAWLWRWNRDARGYSYRSPARKAELLERLEAWETKTGETVDFPQRDSWKKDVEAEKVRAQKRAEEAARLERLKAEWPAVLAAEDGSEVTVLGRTYRKNKGGFAQRWRGGHRMNIEIVHKWSLTDLETGAKVSCQERQVPTSLAR